jgi:hypothetical protein
VTEPLAAAASSAPRWRPRDAAWWPSADARARARQRFADVTPERFEAFEDYFFFLHIHPMNRWVHTVGMLIGTAIFGWSLVLLIAGSWWCVAAFVLGHVFFTGFGIFGHWLYDGAAYVRTEAVSFLRAFPWVIRINVDTLTGRFTHRLAPFVERYPFVRDAWDLVDVREHDAAP